MAVGFVLINVAPKAEKRVFDTMIKWDEIEELYPLFGDYDLIAKIQAKDYETLSDIIVQKIRAMEGVTETKTLTGAKF
ncbi:MAG: Lrp/AsnC ligand binding domain-containing protein [Candidatus Methanoperedens sp.]|jgi:DNA-binding Lrp family transcriptional regulator|nr:Lrp/AsnC ligand binding domain-containing protein [Candidatus Methanoperedens sp.]PKL54057.1 MAG: AsnC family transcriptional regulator [Candidatus Methanoperedenaceae archaeon HGW-Methanoperedenaceae-1]